MKSKTIAKEMKATVKKSKLVDPVSRIRIAGEGRDESGNRYIMIAIRDTGIALSPYSMRELIENKDRLFTELSNAGVPFLTPKAQRELLEFLQSRPLKKESFTVATKLGWNS